MVVMELPLQCTSQEEQAGGSSANYDVELIHLAEAHRDILRAGVCVCVGTMHLPQTTLHTLATSKWCKFNSQVLKHPLYTLLLKC